MKQSKEEPSLDDVLNNLEKKKFETEINPINGRLQITKTNDEADFKLAKSYVDEENKHLENLGVVGRDIFPIEKNEAKEVTKTKEYFGTSDSKNIHGAFKSYSDEKQKLKSFRHYKEAISSFIEWITATHPNIPVNKIRKDQLRDYKSFLLNKKNEKRKKDKLDENTVWKKLSFIRSFFIYCQENDWLPQGDRNIPTFGVIGDRPDPLNNENSYVRFGNDELEKIFNTKNYKDKFLKFDEKRPHLYWFPILGAFTGSRSAEIANIDLNLIENNNPEKIWMFTIHGDVKNSSSIRTIPIHQTLIDLGLLEYIKDLKTVFPNAKTLFPYSNDVDGEQFINYIKDLGIKTDGKKVFHSFRKNVAHLLHHGGCPDKLSKYYTGHLQASLHKNIYEGYDYPLNTFKNYLVKSVVYPIDVLELKYQSGMFNDFLKSKA